MVKPSFQWMDFKGYRAWTCMCLEVFRVRISTSWASRLAISTLSSFSFSSNFWCRELSLPVYQISSRTLLVPCLDNSTFLKVLVWVVWILVFKHKPIWLDCLEQTSKIWCKECLWAFRTIFSSTWPGKSNTEELTSPTRPPDLKTTNTLFSLLPHIQHNPTSQAIRTTRSTNLTIKWERPSRSFAPRRRRYVV